MDNFSVLLRNHRFSSKVLELCPLNDVKKEIVFVNHLNRKVPQQIQIQFTPAI